MIGINGRGSFEKRGRVNVGVGYAISINQIKNFMGLLASGRIVDHATLGATATTDEGARVVVTNLLESADAYRRGLRYGDELLTLAGRRIDSANTLKNVLGTLPKGWRVPLTVCRGDEQFEHARAARTGVHADEELLKLSRQEIMPQPEDEPEPRGPRREGPQPEGPDQRDDEQVPQLQALCETASSGQTSLARGSGKSI